MDRISALRNIEDALAAFEEGEVDLAGLERDVRGTLRTYATDFDGDLHPYRATGDDIDPTVILAPSMASARERVRALLDTESEFDLERVE